MPARIWQQFDELAKQTNSIDPVIGLPVWYVLLHKIGNNPVVLNQIKSTLNGMTTQHTAQTIIRPVEPVTETLAHIRLDTEDNRVTVKFPERHDDFRALVKKLDYRWSDYDFCWERKLDDLSGNLVDRAAELGRKLLLADFCVTVNDMMVQKLAMSGEFESECRRWIRAITNGPYKNWFSIFWRYRGNEKVYDLARKVTGSKYKKPSVIVPPEHFDQVLDFAEIHKFQFSEAAKRLLEKAEAMRDGALVFAGVEIKEDTVIIETESNGGEILDDLADDLDFA